MAVTERLAPGEAEVVDARADGYDWSDGLEGWLGRLVDLDVRDAVGLALVALGIGLWLTSLGSIDAAASNDFGLIGQLPPVWWLSLAVIVAALAVGARSSDGPRSWSNTCLLVSGTAALTLVLHGTASAAEPVTRFPTAYVHAGFSQYIAQHGRTLPDVDLRMSWAGFFAGVAFTSRAMGVSPNWFMKWAEFVQELAYLVPLKIIADANLRSKRARWMALWLFLAANWVGQDYFSPQGMNLFLYLTIVAVLCRALGAERSVWAPVRRLGESRIISSGRRATARMLRLPSDIAPAEARQLEISPGTRLFLYCLVLLIVFASISSHQFTPLVIALVAAALALIGRTRVTALWALCIAGVAAWTSFLAIAWWSGHIGDLFGGVGNVGGTLDQNVAVRLQGSAARLFVVDSRIALALGVWAVAGFAFLRALRHGRSHWTLLALLVSPAAVIVGQSYGGEAALRVLLFTLAPASILIASLFDNPESVGPRPRRPGTWLAASVCVGTLIVSLVLFPVARWGNESFEAVSTGDRAAVEWVYANVPHGATLIAADGSLPWRDAHLADYAFGFSPGLLIDLAPGDIHAAFARTGRNTYLVLTRGQGNYGHLVYGTASGWLEQIGDALSNSPGFRVVYRNADAVVVRLLVGGEA